MNNINIVSKDDIPVKKYLSYQLLLNVIWQRNTYTHTHDNGTDRRWLNTNWILKWHIYFTENVSVTIQIQISHSGVSTLCQSAFCHLRGMIKDWKSAILLGVTCGRPVSISISLCVWPRCQLFPVAVYLCYSTMALE